MSSVGSVAKNILATFYSSDEPMVIATSCMVSEFLQQSRNYSSVFSFWDRIAGTFRLRRNGQPVNFGLGEYDGEAWQRLPGLMLMPFAPAHRGSAAAVKNV